MTTASRALIVSMLWASIAFAQSSAGGAALTSESAADPARWRLVAVRHALDSAQSVDDAYRAGETFAAIARAQIAIEDRDGAEASIRSALAKSQDIRQPDFRGWVLHEIVEAQLALDDVIGARLTADSIAAQRPQGAAYALLAHRLLRTNNLDAAEAISLKIRDPEAAGQILADLAATRASRGDIEHARELARRIDENFYAASALGYIAIAQARAGNLAAAKASVLRAPRPDRAKSIAQLALWQAEQGNPAAAEMLASDVEDPLDRALLLARLGLDSKRNEDTKRAGEFFAATHALVEDANIGSRRDITTLLQIARLQASAGLTGEARALLRTSYDRSAALTVRDRDAVLEGIARTYLRLGDFTQAVSTGLSIQDRIACALVIRDAVTLQMAGTDVATLPDDQWRDDALVSTAAEFGVLASRIGRAQPALVRATIMRARDRVQQIEDSLLTPAALAALAAASLGAGDQQLATDIFAEALRTASLIQRPDQRALAFTRIATALNDRLLFLGRPAQPTDDCGSERNGCIR